jgi:release factor glutamine methyltransferase
MHDDVAGVTVSSLLAWARAQNVDRLDAHLLLAHHLGVGRTWLIAHDGDLVDATLAAAFRRDVAERAAGVPLAYQVGYREFHGLTLKVSPAVLVPRPDTEVLVEWALGWLAAQRPPPQRSTVLDLGTGSGAIALAVARACPHARVTAVDCSLEALAVARHNAQALGLTVEWLHGDWFVPVAGRRFDLMLGNPPYIDADDPHLAALHAEPLAALSPGADGLSALHCIIEQASAHLVPGGALMLEHGHQQAAAVRQALMRADFIEVLTLRDLGGNERCTGGQWVGVAAGAGRDESAGAVPTRPDE